MGSPESPLARIKAGTDALHHKLDRQSVMQCLMAPDLDRVRYAAVLRRLHACYAALEPPLQGYRQTLPQPPAWFDARYYHRCGDLALDLQALGHAAVDPPDPPAGAAPRPGNLAEAAGAIYVLAGASLGARIIERQLRVQLEAGPELLHFFGQRADPGLPGWPALRQALDAALADPADEALALDMAQRVYGHFMFHLGPPL